MIPARDVSEQDQEADVEAAEATSDRVFPIGGNDLKQNPCLERLGRDGRTFRNRYGKGGRT